MKIEFTARGSREADGREHWWRSNRPAAPDLFERELVHALDRIRTAPLSGRLYASKSGREYWRVLLPQTRHHVYYRLIAADRVAVASVWSAVRGRGPTL